MPDFQNRKDQRLWVESKDVHAGTRYAKRLFDRKEVSEAGSILALVLENPEAPDEAYHLFREIGVGIVKKGPDYCLTHFTGSGTLVTDQILLESLDREPTTQNHWQTVLDVLRLRLPSVKELTDVLVTAYSYGGTGEENTLMYQLVNDLRSRFHYEKKGLALMTGSRIVYETGSGVSKYIESWHPEHPSQAKELAIPVGPHRLLELPEGLRNEVFGAHRLDYVVHTYQLVTGYTPVLCGAPPGTTEQRPVVMRLIKLLDQTFIGDVPLTEKAATLGFNRKVLR